MDRVKKFILNKNYHYIWGIIAFWAVVYIPYLFKGGFIVDDWGVIVKTQGFWDQLLSWFPLFSNRPLAPIYLTIAHTIFQSSEFYYIIFNLLLWLGSILIIGNCLRQYFSNRFVITFSLFASLPVVATSFIFSPVMQSLNSFTVFLWSISFLMLNKYLINKQKRWYFAIYLTILWAMLTYEVIIPLLVITVFYPNIVEGINFKKDKWKNFAKYFLKYILPVIIILGFVIIFQKVIIPRISITYSRLPDNILNIMVHDGFGIFLYWLKVFILDFPILILSSVKNKLFSGLFVIAIVCVITFFITYYIDNKNENNTTNSNRKKKLIFIIILTFLSSSMPFLLSDTHAEIIGYINRGLSTSWLTFSLVIGVIFNSKNRIVLFIFILILFLTTSTYLIEEKNYINSYALQNDIARDCINQLNKFSPHQGVSIIGYVPEITESSIIGEDVFKVSWDFGNALAIKSTGFITSGDTINKYKRLAISQDQITIDDWSTSFENLWFYQYDQITKQSSIVRIKNEGDALNMLKYINDNDINTYPGMSYPKNLVDNIARDTARFNFHGLYNDIKSIIKYIFPFN